MDDYHGVVTAQRTSVSLATARLLGEPGQFILINDQTEPVNCKANWPP